MERGWSLGIRFSSQHRDSAFVLSLILLTGLATAACIQAAIVWRGAWSVPVLGAGALLAVISFAAQRRQLTQPTPLTFSVLRANAYAGSLLGLAFVLGFIMPRPKSGVTALILISDGYVALICLSLTLVLFIVRRRRLRD